MTSFSLPIYLQGCCLCITTYWSPLVPMTRMLVRSGSLLCYSCVPEWWPTCPHHCVCLNKWKALVHTGSHAFAWFALSAHLIINTSTHVATKTHCSPFYGVYPGGLAYACLAVFKRSSSKLRPKILKVFCNCLTSEEWSEVGLTCLRWEEGKQRFWTVIPGWDGTRASMAALESGVLLVGRTFETFSGKPLRLQMRKQRPREVKHLAPHSPMD